MAGADKVEFGLAAAFDQIPTFAGKTLSQHFRPALGQWLYSEQNIKERASRF